MKAWNLRTNEDSVVTFTVSCGYTIHTVLSHSQHLVGTQYIRFCYSDFDAFGTRHHDCCILRWNLGWLPFCGIVERTIAGMPCLHQKTRCVIESAIKSERVCVSRVSVWFPSWSVRAAGECWFVRRTRACMCMWQRTDAAHLSPPVFFPVYAVIMIVNVWVFVHLYI